MQARGVDSAYSWVVASSIGIIFLMAAWPMRLGSQLFVEMIERYDTSRKDASLPFAIAYCVRSLTGPFSGYFGNKFGLQQVTLFGGVLCALGVGLCYFSEEIISINIFLGLIYGCGFGFASSVGPEIINQHFSKHRAKGFSVVMGLSGFINILTPPLLELVIDVYGVSGSFLIMSGIILNTIPAAMLLTKPEMNEAKCAAVRHHAEPLEMSNEKEMFVAQSVQSRSSISKLTANKNGQEPSISDTLNANFNGKWTNISNKDSNLSSLRPALLSKTENLDQLTEIRKEHIGHQSSLKTSILRKGNDLDLVKSNSDKFKKEANLFLNENTYNSVDDEVNLSLTKGRDSKLKEEVNLDLTKDKDNQLKEEINLDLTEVRCCELKEVVNLDLTEDSDGNFKEEVNLDLTEYCNSKLKEEVNLDLTEDCNSKLKKEGNLDLTENGDNKLKEEVNLDQNEDSDNKLKKEVRLDLIKNFDNQLKEEVNLNLTEDRDAKLKEDEMKKEVNSDTFENNHRKLTNETKLDLTENKDNRLAESKYKSIDILWNPIFLFITFIESSHFYVMYISWTVTVDLVRDKEISKHEEVYFVMALALLDTIGRSALGFVTDSKLLTAGKHSALCFGVMGLSLLLLVWVSGFALTMTAICIFGFICGSNTTVMPGIVTEFIEKEKRTMAMASRLLMYAPMSFTMSPLIGYFRGVLGAYDGLLYVMTTLCLSCSVILLLLPRLHASTKTIT